MGIIGLPVPTALSPLGQQVLLPLGVLIEGVLGAELLSACVAREALSALGFVPAADVSQPKPLATASTHKVLSAVDSLVVL